MSEVATDMGTRHCERDPCRIPDCDCKPLATGKWYIERKLNDGNFSTYAEGYETLAKAKTAAGRAGKSIRYTSTWRVIHEDDGEVLETHEATFRPGGRAKWSAVLVGDSRDD